MKLLKGLIENLFKIKIYRTLPFGIDPIEDLKFTIKNLNLDIIFDVGANEGQSAVYLRKKLLQSKIYSFEPFTKTFNLLRSNTSKLNIQTYKLALGEENKDIDVHIDLNNSSDLYSIKSNPKTTNSTTEKISIVTLDSFCNKNNINHIDYLKIDTEGNDLNVLLGAKLMLQNEQIKIIEVEVGMHINNETHIYFNEFIEFLSQFNYGIFGIYEQTHEWKKKAKILRRVNMVFVLNKIAQY